MDHRGHAAHFLTRVDRLNAQHAELALGLYRDHQLVKYLLRLVQVPENSQRVALALDDTRDAPHVIVTRDGAFVTCLGRGMRVNGAAVVSRRSLDEVSSRAEALRQLLVEAQAGGTKERDRHMRRLRKARGALTREEFENLLKWAPLLAGDYLQRAIHTAGFVRQAMGRLKLARRIGTRHEPLLRAFCERSWEIQHLAMLLAADRRGLQVAITRADRNAGGTTRHHTWLIHELMATGNWVGLFRGALLAASMSDLVVPALISQVEPGAFNLDSQTRSLTALLAVLLRSPDLETTIVPVFERWSTRSDSLTEEFLASWANLLLAIWRNPTPDLFTRVSVEFADKLAETQLDTAQQCERMKNFARTSKRAMFAALPLPFSVVDETVAAQLTYLWEICNMSPADLYPPFKDRFRVGWTRREGMFWLEPQLKPCLQPKRRPFVKAAQPERNDPCPCDSGKKYKRCCGAN